MWKVVDCSLMTVICSYVAVEAHRLHYEVNRGKHEDHRLCIPAEQSL